MRLLRSALVLGGAGFLGSWLVDCLLAREVRTAVVDDLSTGRRKHVGNADLITADVCDPGLPRIIDERAVDVVFHLAGPAYVPPSLTDPEGDLRRTAAATLAVLEALRCVHNPPLLAYASSAAVYGNGRRMPMREDHPLQPESPYGVSKLAAEQYVRLYAELHGIPAFSVRLFSLYGPRQRKQVVYDLLCRAFGGEEPLVVLGSPEVSRDFTFVQDAAAAFVDLAHSAPARGEAYNVASGKPTTLKELVSTILETAGLAIPMRFTGEVRRGDPLRWEGDPARASDLGVRCGTPLEEGLRRTIKWFIESKGDTLA